MYKSISTLLLVFKLRVTFITKDGRLITEKDHASYTPAEKFFDKDSGALVKGRYFTHKGKWYYANDQESY